MKIFVDIDETICKYLGDRHYPSAIPIKERILRINELYDEGHEITYWTASGAQTGIDWLDVTKKQLNEWSCKYHKLSVGEKPVYDLLICDKAINSNEYFKKEKAK